MSCQVRRRPHAFFTGGQAVSSGVRHASCGPLRLSYGRGARRNLLRCGMQTRLAGTLVHIVDRKDSGGGVLYGRRLLASSHRVAKDYHSCENVSLFYTKFHIKLENKFGKGRLLCVALGNYAFFILNIIQKLKSNS